MFVIIDRMKQGRIVIPQSEFDIGLCVLSGQTFRWEQVGNAWVGMIGRDIVRLQRFDDEVAYETTGDFEAIHSFFRLDANLETIRSKILEEDPSLESRMKRFSGLRVLRWPNAEECLISFACTSNNNIPRIIGMIKRLCDRYGETIVQLNGISFHTFPSAETILETPEDALRGIGFGYRARVIRNIAYELLKRGNKWLESLKKLPYKEAHAELITLPGVGPKIADCVCLFGLDHLEAVPIDTHLWQAVSSWHLPELKGKSLTDLRYRQVGDYIRSRFGDRAGWAHQYLFYAHLKGE